MSRRSLARLAPLTLALALSLSACGDDGDATSPEPATSTPSSDSPAGDDPTSDSPADDSLGIALTREDDTFTPNGERVEAEIDQTITLTITSDVEGELHVHSVPEQEISYDAGTSEHEITIDRPGVVEVESHEPDTIVLQLEVR